jgi:hypothetical protein
MKSPSQLAVSPLRRQSVDTFRRARKLPPGQYREDLRQLALALLKLHKRALAADEPMAERPNKR